MKAISDYWQSINIVSLILLPLSLIFCLLVFLRRYFYSSGLFKSAAADIPVIVVGNIYIGGNGKTPFVIWLARQLKQAGYQPAVVSRGYGALSEKEAGIAWPRRVNLDNNVQLFGDEPCIIYKATQCPVIIDPNRSRAVEHIVHTTSCDVIISDDGLQHYAMSRQIEINITDARRLYGNGLCLPAGPLREGIRRLKTVDYIIYNRAQYGSAHSANCSDASDSNIDTNREKKFFMDYDILPLQSLSNLNRQSMTLADFKGKIVHAVAGIGDPKRFFRLLNSYGLIVIEHAYDDHYHYQEKDLLFESAHPVIMTEKDAVKCQHLNVSNAWFLPIKAKLEQGLIQQIVTQLTSNI